MNHHCVFIFIHLGVITMNLHYSHYEEQATDNKRI